MIWFQWLSLLLTRCGIKSGVERCLFLRQIEPCSLWGHNVPWTLQKSSFDLKIIISNQKVALPGKSSELLSRQDIWCMGPETTNRQINLWFYTHLMAIESLRIFDFSYSNLSLYAQLGTSGDKCPISNALKAGSSLSDVPRSLEVTIRGIRPHCDEC